VSFVKIESNVDNMVANLNVASERLAGAPYGAARDAFRDVEGFLTGSIRELMTGQAFVPLSQVTKDYKARKGLDSRILFATGNTYGGIRSAGGATWAKAMRGQEEWYIFLHDRGKGFAHWSQEGEDRASSSGKRRHRAKGEGRRRLVELGTTRFPQRQSFLITEAAEGSILNRLELFYQELVDEVGQ